MIFLIFTMVFLKTFFVQFLEYSVTVLSFTILFVVLNFIFNKAKKMKELQDEILSDKLYS